jgi:hypothetical protein
MGVMDEHVLKEIAVQEADILRRTELQLFQFTAPWWQSSETL